ncbi:hypothetical protein, partial [Kamptonema sp. PCC 6506]|uniref:hypothetical protein n=1 Tax=Kamptonema sp. PCC 6506 TaxID=272129 RepID=UPI0005880579
GEEGEEWEEWEEENRISEFGGTQNILNDESGCYNTGSCPNRRKRLLYHHKVKPRRIVILSLRGFSFEVAIAAGSSIGEVLQSIGS